MKFILQPWLLFFLILAGRVNREQQEVIEYLRTENQVLKEKLVPKRILLNDDQRRRLAVKGKILGRKRLEEVGTLFHAVVALAFRGSARKRGGRRELAVFSCQLSARSFCVRVLLAQVPPALRPSMASACRLLVNARCLRHC